MPSPLAGRCGAWPHERSENLKDDKDGTKVRTKPTLKTIAQLTGLAVPTVSRALSGAQDISADTRARVRETATRIGYVPNRAGVRVRTWRTSVISLVLSTEHDVMNHTARLMSSVAGSLRGTPYHLILTPYFADEDPMVPIRYIVETGSADAVIFNQITPRDPRVAYLMERHFPFVTHGRTDWSDRHAWFDYDNAAFGRVALDALGARGRRNVLMVAPPQDQTYARDMILGARGRAKDLGLGFELLPDRTSDSPIGEVEASIRRYLATSPATDAILCGSTNSGLAAVSGAELSGRAVGRAIDVFTKEAIPFIRRIRPDVMAAREDVGAAGTFMAEAAVRLLTDSDAPPMQHLDVPGPYSLD